MDETRGEACDDGNLTPADGCESDCTFTCTADEDCDSGDACAPSFCNDAHRCEVAEPVVCDDGDPCTRDACDEVIGCVATAADGDGDGYLAEAVEGCALPAGDCNDGNPDVFPGQTTTFATPIAGAGGYDYDCDGVETRAADCGGNCGINYTLGTCWISPRTTCTGPCGSLGRQVRSCSDAYRCNNVYSDVIVGCR